MVNNSCRLWNSRLFRGGPLLLTQFGEQSGRPVQPQFVILGHISPTKAFIPRVIPSRRGKLDKTARGGNLHNGICVPAYLPQTPTSCKMTGKNGRLTEGAFIA
jgi:hypothetical protein